MAKGGATMVLIKSTNEQHYRCNRIETKYWYSISQTRAIANNGHEFDSHIDDSVSTCDELKIGKTFHDSNYHASPSRKSKGSV